MRVEIEAKLNLCLAIRGTEGNRHLIDSLFVPVGIKDAVSGEKAEKVEVAYTDGRVYERDTAYLAARAVIERYAMGGARFLKRVYPRARGSAVRARTRARWREYSADCTDGKTWTSVYWRQSAATCLTFTAEERRGCAAREIYAKRRKFRVYTK